MTRTRRSFTDGFKREAVRLCKQPRATAKGGLLLTWPPGIQPGPSGYSVAQP